MKRVAHELAHVLRYATGEVDEAFNQELAPRDMPEKVRKNAKLRGKRLAEAHKTFYDGEEEAVQAILKRWGFV
jgi:hypothetical protein